MPPKRKLNASNNGQPRTKRGKPSTVPLTLAQRSRGTLAALPNGVLKMIADRVARPVDAWHHPSSALEKKISQTIPVKNIRSLQGAMRVDKALKVEGFQRAPGDVRRELDLIRTSDIRRLFKMYGHVFYTEVQLARHSTTPTNRVVMQNLFRQIIASKPRQDQVYAWLQMNIETLPNMFFLTPDIIKQAIGWILPYLLRVLRSASRGPSEETSVRAIAVFVTIIWYINAADVSEKHQAFEVLAELARRSETPWKVWASAAAAAIAARWPNTQAYSWVVKPQIMRAMRRDDWNATNETQRRDRMQKDIASFAKALARQAAGRAVVNTNAKTIKYGMNSTIDATDRRILDDAKPFFRDVLRYVVRTDDPQLVSWFVQFSGLKLNEEPRKWFKYSARRTRMGAAAGFVRAGHALNVRSPQMAPVNWNTSEPHAAANSNAENDDDGLDDFAALIKRKNTRFFSVDERPGGRQEIMNAMFEKAPRATYGRASRALLKGW